MKQHFSTANFTFHFIKDEHHYAVYRDNIRVASFDPVETTIKFKGGDTFTLWMLDELKPAMKELTDYARCEALVEEYFEDPNCRPDLWIRDLFDTHEVTKNQMYLFLARVSEKKVAK